MIDVVHVANAPFSNQGPIVSDEIFEPSEPMVRTIKGSSGRSRSRRMPSPSRSAPQLGGYVEAKTDSGNGSLDSPSAGAFFVRQRSSPDGVWRAMPPTVPPVLASKALPPLKEDRGLRGGADFVERRVAWRNEAGANVARKHPGGGPAAPCKTNFAPYEADVKSCKRQLPKVLLARLERTAWKSRPAAGEGGFGVVAAVLDTAPARPSANSAQQRQGGASSVPRNKSAAAERAEDEYMQRVRAVRGMFGHAQTDPSSWHVRAGPAPSPRILELAKPRMSPPVSSDLSFRGLQMVDEDGKPVKQSKNRRPAHMPGHDNSSAATVPFRPPKPAKKLHPKVPRAPKAAAVPPASPGEAEDGANDELVAAETPAAAQREIEDALQDEKEGNKSMEPEAAADGVPVAEAVETAVSAVASAAQTAPAVVAVGATTDQADAKPASEAFVEAAATEQPVADSQTAMADGDKEQPIPLGATNGSDALGTIEADHDPSRPFAATYGSNAFEADESVVPRAQTAGSDEFEADDLPSQPFGATYGSNAFEADEAAIPRAQTAGSDGFEVDDEPARPFGATYGSDAFEVDRESTRPLGDTYASNAFEDDQPSVTRPQTAASTEFEADEEPSRPFGTTYGSDAFEGDETSPQLAQTVGSDEDTSRPLATTYGSNAFEVEKEPSRPFGTTYGSSAFEADTSEVPNVPTIGSDEFKGEGPVVPCAQTAGSEEAKADKLHTAGPQIDAKADEPTIQHDETADLTEPRPLGTTYGSDAVEVGVSDVSRAQTVGSDGFEADDDSKLNGRVTPGELGGCQREPGDELPWSPPRDSDGTDKAPSIAEQASRVLPTSGVVADGSPKPSGAHDEGGDVVSAQKILGPGDTVSGPNSGQFPSVLPSDRNERNSPETKEQDAASSQPPSAGVTAEQHLEAEPNTNSIAGPARCSDGEGVDGGGQTEPRELGAACDVTRQGTGLASPSSPSPAPKAADAYSEKNSEGAGIALQPPTRDDSHEASPRALETPSGADVAAIKAPSERDQGGGSTGGSAAAIHETEATTQEAGSAPLGAPSASAVAAEEPMSSLSPVSPSTNLTAATEHAESFSPGSPVTSAAVAKENSSPIRDSDSSETTETEGEPGEDGFAALAGWLESGSPPVSPVAAVSPVSPPVLGGTSGSDMFEAAESEVRAAETMETAGTVSEKKDTEGAAADSLQNRISDDTDTVKGERSLAVSFNDIAEQVSPSRDSGTMDGFKGGVDEVDHPLARPADTSSMNASADDCDQGSKQPPAVHVDTYAMDGFEDVADKANQLSAQRSDIYAMDAFENDVAQKAKQPTAVRADTYAVDSFAKASDQPSSVRADTYAMDTFDDAKDDTEPVKVRRTSTVRFNDVVEEAEQSTSRGDSGAAGGFEVGGVGKTHEHFTSLADTSSTNAGEDDSSKESKQPPVVHADTYAMDGFEDGVAEEAKQPTAVRADTYASDAFEEDATGIDASAKAEQPSATRADTYAMDGFDSVKDDTSEQPSALRSGTYATDDFVEGAASEAEQPSAMRSDTYATDAFDDFDADVGGDDALAEQPSIAPTDTYASDAFDNEQPSRADTYASDGFDDTSPPTSPLGGGSRAADDASMPTSPGAETYASEGFDDASLPASPMGPSSNVKDHGAASPSGHESGRESGAEYSDDDFDD
eukprot:TRINITY_DN48492_c0_g1_i1.p1 TRINITY_DN48492_c0_g1~~TRINITY_DN48492_c0_g1_i1.p1  ORF type:complete len:1664 (+),score=335.15 TRINITY_DN48492_c0_g1_i1:114-5105(+)